MPLSCVEDYSVVLSQFSNYGSITSVGTGCTDIQLHLVAKLTSPAGKETAWAARYRVHTAPAPYTFENTPSNPYLQVKENAEVNTLEELINSGIQAWNPITIKNDVVITTGPVQDFLNNRNPYEVVVQTNPVTGISYQALVRKEVTPGVVISAPFVIDRMPNCGSNPPVDAEYLASFCPNTMRYNPILSLSRPLEEEIAEWEDAPALPLRAPTAVLSPNPVRDQAWLDYHVAEEGPVSIFVSDHAGRRVLSLQAQVQHAEGTYHTAIPAGELPAGMYFVSVVRQTGVETLKLLKQ